MCRLTQAVTLVTGTVITRNLGLGRAKQSRHPPIHPGEGPGMFFVQNMCHKDVCRWCGSSDHFAPPWETHMTGTPPWGGGASDRGDFARNASDSRGIGRSPFYTIMKASERSWCDELSCLNDIQGKSVHLVSPMSPCPTGV